MCDTVLLLAPTVALTAKVCEQIHAVCQFPFELLHGNCCWPEVIS